MKKSIGIMVFMMLFAVFLGAFLSWEQIYASQAGYQNQIDSLEQSVAKLSELEQANIDLINEINKRGYVVSSDFVKELYTLDNITIEAGKSKEITLCESVSKSGYVSKGVLGYYLNNATKNGKNRTHCMINRLYLSGDSLKMLIRNTSSEYDAVIKANATVLFIKDK